MRRALDRALAPENRHDRNDNHGDGVHYRQGQRYEYSHSHGSTGGYAHGISGVHDKPDQRQGAQESRPRVHTARASERVAQERREQQGGASEYGEETTRESEEESALEQQPWGTEETQEGGGTDTYETGREEDGWHARGSKDCARRGRTSE